MHPGTYEPSPFDAQPRQRKSPRFRMPFASTFEFDVEKRAGAGIQNRLWLVIEPSVGPSQQGIDGSKEEFHTAFHKTPHGFVFSSIPGDSLQHPSSPTWPKKHHLPRPRPLPPRQRRPRHLRLNPPSRPAYRMLEFFQRRIGKQYASPVTNMIASLQVTDQSGSTPPPD